MTAPTKQQIAAAEAAAEADLLAAGISHRQHCAHLVAALYARLGLNNHTEDGTPFVYPSVDRVAQMLKYSTRQVKRANAMLAAAGLWETIGRYARRAVRAFVKGDTRAQSKGDTVAHRKVTPRPVTRSEAIYLLNREKNKAPGDRPTPTPPAYVGPQGPAPVADPALRAHLRASWRKSARV